MQIAGHVEHDFELLKSVIKVNNNQQSMLVDKVLNRLGGVTGKTIALLGLSFKPNTDDMRDAPSIVIADRLAALDARMTAYDPIASFRALRAASGCGFLSGVHRRSRQGSGCRPDSDRLGTN